MPGAGSQPSDGDEWMQAVNFQKAQKKMACAMKMLGELAGALPQVASSGARGADDRCDPRQRGKRPAPATAATAVGFPPFSFVALLLTYGQ